MPPAAQSVGESDGAGALPVPYKVARAWPEDGWDLLPLFRDERDAVADEPARYLHPSVAVKEIRGRSRGVVATDNVKRGELILFDSPILTAESYEALLEQLQKRSHADGDEAVAFRREVLSMCGDPADDEARSCTDSPPSMDLLRNIVRHNYHGVDSVPMDGGVPDGPPGRFGLWPLGSLVNHALSPNVTRSFVGLHACYRAIRPIAAGEEVLDNYLDLRFPRARRQDSLNRNHGMADEGPDAHDAPGGLIGELQAKHEEAMSLAQDGTEQSAQDAFATLADLGGRCAARGSGDPAFCDLLRDLSTLAGQLGDAEVCLQSAAMAVEHATAREPYSVISYMLALRMAHMACVAGGDVDADTRGSLEQLARRHFAAVFGPCPGAFEARNPELVAAMLVASQQSVKPAAGCGEAAPSQPPPCGGADAKRPLSAGAEGCAEAQQAAADLEAKRPRADAP